MNDVHIRASPEFKSLVNRIRAKELLMNRREISISDVTKALVKYIDWEKVWQNEFDKK